jgi:hypothetical protein
MAMASYAEVLKAAHRLPPTAQAKLVTALLRSLKPPASGQQPLSDASELNPLRGMSLAELQVLAEAVIAPAHQKALTRLGESTPLYHALLQSWNDHFVWSNDGATVIGLTAIARATVSLLHMNRPVLVQMRRWRSRRAGIVSS